MSIATQTSSKPRLKNDTLGEDTLKSLYEAYSTMGSDEFQSYCIDVVQAGGGHQPTKDKIIQSIQTTKNKDTQLKKAQDFILAGMGLGV